MNANPAWDAYHKVEHFKKSLRAQARQQQVRSAGYAAYVVYYWKGSGAPHAVHISEGKHADISRLPRRMTR